ncbi:hypothetical protein RUND412_009960 [Rhizina undulata]
MTDHPDAVQLVVAGTVLFAVGSAFVIFRLYVSATRPSPNVLAMKVSDAFVLFGWIMVTTAWVCLCYRASQDIEWGKSKDPVVLQYGLPKALQTINGKLIVVEMFSYYTALWTAKAAFLAMYYGLVVGLSAGLRWTLYITMAYAGLGYVALMFLSGFICRPFHRNWEYVPNACRIVSAETVLLSTILNVSTDLLIMVLPLLILRSFTIRRRDKFAIMFLMSLGMMSITAASVRVFVFTKMHLTDSLDLSNARKIELLSVVELAAVFIAACSPSLRAFFMRRKQWGTNDEASDGSDRSGTEGMKKPGQDGYRMMDYPSAGTEGETFLVAAKNGEV